MSAPGKAEIRAEPVAPPADGRGARARGRERAQPRDRAAGLFGTCAGERVRAHARAIHERGVSFSREIWLRDGGPRRGRPGGARKAASVSRFIRTRPCLTLPPKISCRCPTGCRRSAPCSPPTWRRRSTPLGTARRDRPTASRWSAPGVLGLLVARLCARMPGTAVTVVDIEPSRAAIAAQARRAPSRRPTRRRRTAISWSTPARRRPGLRPRCGLAGDEATVLELSWYGANDVHGAARRRFPFAPAEARLEPGRAGRAVAPRRAGTYRRRLDGRAATCWTIRRSMRCSRRRSRSATCRTSCPTFSTPRAACSASSIRYP